MTLIYNGSIVRRAITQLPVVGPVAKKLYRKIMSGSPPLEFKSTAQYWQDRYAAGGNSGAGSYGRLAQFKADVINDFVAKNAIETVIEFGCGDGAQLQLARYPHYTGIDICSQAIDVCRTKFPGDASKQFFHTSSPEADKTRADLAMSLDVVYHLVEDRTYDAYMSRLVSASKKYLCIYSSDEERPCPVAHIRHRRFTAWLATRAPQWKQILKVPNLYPEDPNRSNETSWADFFFFEKDRDTA
jgi:hypothetical protein